MPCRKVNFGNGPVILCGPKLYKFNEWFFEWHSYCGPWPLRKDGELRKRAGRTFWKVVGEFTKLSKEERKKYEIDY